MSHPNPAHRGPGFCTTTTIHAMPVPRAPKIANSGQSTPRMRRLGRIVNASVSVRPCTRRAITETCAIVNDSIAPNAYISPRNVVFPGSSTMIEIKPAKMTSDSHGVLNFGCKRRNTSGNCR